MRIRALVTLAALLFCGGHRTIALPAKQADLVLTGGKIFTANDAAPWADAVAAAGGRIVAVGTDREVARFIGPRTKVLDVRGKLVIPGLIDAHTHFASGGRSLIGLSFRGVASIPKVREMIAARIRELPPGALVSGSAYDHTLFPGGAWPSRKDLDEVSPVESRHHRARGRAQHLGEQPGPEDGRHHEGHEGPLRRRDPQGPGDGRADRHPHRSRGGSCPDRGPGGRFHAGRGYRPRSRACGRARPHRGAHRFELRRNGDLPETRGRGRADPSRLCLAAHRTNEGLPFAKASGGGRATTWSASGS